MSRPQVQDEAEEMDVIDLFSGSSNVGAVVNDESNLDQQNVRYVLDLDKIRKVGLTIVKFVGSTILADFIIGKVKRKFKKK